MNWDAAARTDRGRLRPANEDAFSLQTDSGFFALADGMGGHAAGEVASRMAVECLVDRCLAAGCGRLPGEALEALLVEATRAANEAILERGEREADKAGMGTTLTALALAPAAREYCVVHVGDSRAYRMRTGALVQLTTDHSWVQEQIQLGRLSPAGARDHPFSNVVTRALGIAGDLDVDVARGELRPGDVYLLCSDGLTGMVDDAGIEAILAGAAEAEAMAAGLVHAANRAGGVDNITAVVIRILEDGPRT